MKKSLTLIMVAVTLVSTLARSADIEKEKEGVIQAALDYMEGGHEGNAARIERSVHPELNKCAVRTVQQTGRNGLSKAGYTRLLELVRADVIHLDGEKRQIEITVYTVKEGLACVKAVSPQFSDYLQLAKIDGRWKVINVLFRTIRNGPEEESSPEQEEDDIKQAVLDYLDGWYTGDADRLARAIHPQLNKVFPVTVPQTGKTMLNYSSYELMVEWTRAGVGILDEDKREIQLTVLDIDGEIAMVEALSAMYYDYVQLARINGQWKIVNVLWKMNPSATRPER